MEAPEAPFERLGIAVSIHHSLLEDKAAPRRADRWRAITTGYEYMFVDQLEREILTFHWHPRQRSHVTWPHLHIGCAVLERSFISNAHIPTGRVALEQVLRLAIEDFRVEPKRTDWDRVLRLSLQVFLQNRSWSDEAPSPVAGRGS